MFRCSKGCKLEISEVQSKYTKLNMKTPIHSHRLSVELVHLPVLEPCVGLRTVLFHNNYMLLKFVLNKTESLLETQHIGTQLIFHKLLFTLVFLFVKMMFAILSSIQEW